MSQIVSQHTPHYRAYCYYCNRGILWSDLHVLCLKEEDCLSFTVKYNPNEPIEISFQKGTTYELENTILLVKEYNELEDKDPYFINYLVRLEEILFCQVV